MMTNARWRKVCRLGTIPRVGGRMMSVFVAIEYGDSGDLSITGVEGPMPSGNCLGACGQIDMHLRPEHFRTYAPGWDAEKVTRLLQVWDRWHLNNMHAGTPEQEQAVRERHAITEIPAPRAYSHLREYLKGRNLLHVPDPDNPGEVYTYGARWLREDVPADVLQWLYNRPAADRSPAWV